MQAHEGLVPTPTGYPDLLNANPACRAATPLVAPAQTLLRMLQHSLAQPERLSSHPAAAAPRFRLLLLALRFARQRAASLADAGSPVPLALVLLHDRVVKAGLTW